MKIQIRLAVAVMLLGSSYQGSYLFSSGQVVSHPLPKAKFTLAEDAQLLQLVKALGENWREVAARMVRHNARRCKERWHNYLSPDINMESFTQEEDILLLNKFKEVGPRWSHMTVFFPGKTYIQLKNRWMWLQRHQQTQSLQQFLQQQQPFQQSLLQRQRLQQLQSQLQPFIPQILQRLKSNIDKNSTQPPLEERPSTDGAIETSRLRSRQPLDFSEDRLLNWEGFQQAPDVPKDQFNDDRVVAPVDPFSQFGDSLDDLFR